MAWPSATDYVEAIQHPRTCFKDAELQLGTPALDRLGMPFVSSGQFAYVFKLKNALGQASAIRCFRGIVRDREQRYQAIDAHLDSVSVNSLASFEYDSTGILVGPNRFPILVMEWIDGPTLDVYIEAALQNRVSLKHLADEWIGITKKLRAAQIAHGDLQHGNIIVQNGTLRLVDLDGMFVPSMAKLNSSELGHRHYQHPRRDEFVFNRDLDNFSALVIYISLISLSERPELWGQFHDENLIFTRPDFLSPSKSRVFDEVKKLAGESRRLVEILEKACIDGPSATPSLENLVSTSSKLPLWMRQPVGIAIATKTREVVAGNPLSGAKSNSGQVLPSAQSSFPSPGLKSGSSIPPWLGQGTGSAPSSTAQSANRVNWSAFRTDTIWNSVAFGFTGILFVWAWFPLLDGIYRDLGLIANSQALTFWTYVVGCLGFGLLRANQNRNMMVATQLGSPSPGPVPYIPQSTPPTMLTPSTPVRYQVPSASRRPLYNNWSSTQSATSSTPIGFVVASRARSIYHKPTCEWARRISNRNRVTFASSTAAQSARYRPCSVCGP